MPVQDLVAERDGLADRISGLERELGASQGEAAGLERERDALALELQQKNDKIEDLDAALERAAAENVHASQRIAELGDEVERLERALEQEREAARSEAAAHAEEVQRGGAARAALQQRLQALESRLADAQAQLDVRPARLPCPVLLAGLTCINSYQVVTGALVYALACGRGCSCCVTTHQV
jgi:chromosome segregation ATPase